MLRICVGHWFLATRRVSEGRVKIDFPSLTRRVTRKAQHQNLRFEPVLLPIQVGHSAACFEQFQRFDSFTHVVNSQQMDSGRSQGE